MRQQLKTVLITLFILGITKPFFVQAQNSYQPSSHPVQQKTKSSTNRGCRQILPEFEVLVAPEGMAYLGAERTFWLKFAAKPPSPVKVSILQADLPEAPWLDNFVVASKGIFPLKIPASVELKPKIEYSLVVSLACSAEQPERRNYARIFFQYDENKAEEGRRLE